MSDRYTNRETALAAYLQAQLGASYHVTRAPSVADYPIGKRIVMLRWMGLTNDVERNTTEPVSDTCLFSLRCLPGPCVDSAADTGANETADAVIELLRTRSSFLVFGAADGKPCGMRVLRAAKGFVQNTGIVVDVDIEVLFEEDY